MGKIVLGAAATAFLTSLATAQTLRVPQQHPTISAALDAAPAGATVLVAPGTYHESIVWPRRDGIRLLSEDGPRNTIIDAQSQSRVIAFLGFEITRATVLEGFTITGGYEVGSFNYGYGAGIICEQAGPTIRNNRIIANELRLNTNLHGAGLCILRSNPGPLVVGNEIADNHIFDAVNAFGAGIYIDALSRVRVLGNRIHDNGVDPTNHGVRGVGICNRGTTDIFSNLIHDNVADASYRNLGAGIFNSDATAIYHNTIANNVTTATLIAGAAGVHNQGNYCALRGNIIANNSGVGFENDTLAWPSVDSDHDVFWNNTTNYEAIVAGPNNRHVDPGFVSPGNYHLAAGSPCIDAMSTAHLDRYGFMNTDIDGEPRQLDSDIGSGAPHARVDIGADEVCGTFASHSGTPQPGGTINWHAFGPSTTNLHALLIALRYDDSLVTPIGNLLLRSPIAPLIGPGQQGTWQQSIPATPNLTGITLLGQAAALNASTGAGQLSAVWAVTIR